jgi:two-component SAPR family response regulator
MARMLLLEGKETGWAEGETERMKRLFMNILFKNLFITWEVENGRIAVQGQPKANSS